jgi:hypothetical protein
MFLGYPSNVGSFTTAKKAVVKLERFVQLYYRFFCGGKVISTFTTLEGKPVFDCRYLILLTKKIQCITYVFVLINKKKDRFNVFFLHRNGLFNFNYLF